MKKGRKLWRIAIVLALLAAVLLGGAYAYHELLYPGRFGVLVPEKDFRGRQPVFHSRQPQGMQWSVLGRHDIKRVINLCAKVENPDLFAAEREACRAAGAEFVNIPVGTLLPTQEQIAQFLTAVRTSPGPVLFHCQHGRHRTSFMKACYRVLLDRWPVDRAIGEMKANNADPAADEGKLEQTQALLADIRDNRDAWLLRTSGTASAMARPRPTASAATSRQGPGAP